MAHHIAQAKVKSAHCRNSERALPGWGKVANPADWKVVDDAPDDARYDGPGTQGIRRVRAGVGASLAIPVMQDTQQHALLVRHTHLHATRMAGMRLNVQIGGQGYMPCSLTI